MSFINRGANREETHQNCRQELNRTIVLRCSGRDQWKGSEKKKKTSITVEEILHSFPSDVPSGFLLVLTLEKKQRK